MTPPWLGGRRSVIRAVTLFVPVLSAMGCARGPATYEVRPTSGGLEIRGTQAVPRVEVRHGPRLVQRRAASDSHEVFLPVTPRPGQIWQVHVGDQVIDVPGPALPVEMILAVPRGTQGQRVEPGEVVSAVDLGQAVGELRLVPREVPVEVAVRWGERVHRHTLEVVGAPWTVSGPLSAGSLQVTVGEAAPVSVGIDVHAVSEAELRAQLGVTHQAFPTDRLGRADRTRPADALTLPPARWSAFLARSGWSVRDVRAPWAHQAITLHNRLPHPVDVVVEARVEGEGAAAFQPRLRDASSLDRVVASARLPPTAEVTVAMPLYVDPASLRGRAWTRRVRVTPLGLDEPVIDVVAPLVLRRASLATWLGLAVALGAAALGWGGMLTFGRRWLARQSTSDLMTIGLFGALSYVVAGALQVVGHGVAAVLGPFAPLVTGLPDAALRACLLATLVTLLPRPGVAALATVTGALLRALTLGSFHPVDLLYVGSAAFWLEGALWVAGLTRSTAWRDQSTTARWLRTSLALGLANVGAVATGLCVAAALFRLYYAAWYVALLLVVPGFLYIVLGCRVAVELAASLRRVAS